MKTAIAPIISLILLFVGIAFHIDFTEDEKSAIAEMTGLIVTSAITLYGIVKNHFPHKE